MGFRKRDWRRLFLPYFWLQNHPTDWEWDATLNRLLDQYEPIIGYRTLFLGGVEVWAANYPYAYGHPWRPELSVLPSVATRQRLRKAVSAADRKTFQRAIAAAEAKP